MNEEDVAAEEKDAKYCGLDIESSTFMPMPEERGALQRITPRQICEAATCAKIRSTVTRDHFHPRY